jgi:hypothetical protein
MVSGAIGLRKQRCEVHLGLSGRSGGEFKNKLGKIHFHGFRWLGKGRKGKKSDRLALLIASEMDYEL